MRRNVMFGKGREWRPEDDEYRGLHLGPGRGAEVGEYATREPGEYSDSYYGPGDEYARRNVGSDGYERGQYGPRSNENLQVGGVVGRYTPTRSPGYTGYGELHPGERSWADLGVASVHPGESGVTEHSRPSFRGRGPKGYVRSDERLREIICERLTDDPDIDASDIGIEVQGGEVTLTGTVTDRTTKWRAEDLAESCSNGALIHNRLRTRTSADR
ncbi:MAG: BON domain-containing protein [Steroidobacter sp.]